MQVMDGSAHMGMQAGQVDSELCTAVSRAHIHTLAMPAANSITMQNHTAQVACLNVYFIKSFCLPLPLQS